MTDDIMTEDTDSHSHSHLLLQELHGLGIDTIEILSYNYDDIGIDDAIERIKDNKADIERLSEIAKKKIDKIKLSLQVELMKLEKKIKWDESQIHIAVLASDNKKETKTQYKKTYVSGDVVIKKGGKQLSKPAFETEEEKTFVKKMFPDFVEDVKEDKLKWAELKKQLVLKEDGKVLYEGADVSDIIPIQFKPSEIVIK